jgi:hypothetical protein
LGRNNTRDYLGGRQRGDGGRRPDPHHNYLFHQSHIPRLCLHPITARSSMALASSIGFFLMRQRQEPFPMLLMPVLGTVQEVIGVFNKWWRDIRFNTYITSISKHDRKEDSHGRLSMWRASLRPTLCRPCACRPASSRKRLVDFRPNVPACMYGTNAATALFTGAPHHRNVLTFIFPHLPDCFLAERPAATSWHYAASLNSLLMSGSCIPDSLSLRRNSDSVRSCRARNAARQLSSRLRA